MIIALCLLSCAVLAWFLWTPDRPLALLEGKYLASPRDMIQADSWRLHVSDTGRRDAPAGVPIHGFGSSLHTWDGWAPGLGRRRRVIRFDLPGSGLSPRWGERDAMIPIAGSADQLAALAGARLVVIPGVGPVPQEEAAGESLAAVEAFLGRHAPEHRATSSRHPGSAASSGLRRDRVR